MYCDNSMEKGTSSPSSPSGTSTAFVTVTRSLNLHADWSAWITYFRSWKVSIGPSKPSKPSKLPSSVLTSHFGLLLQRMSGLGSAEQTIPIPCPCPWPWLDPFKILSRPILVPPPHVHTVQGTSPTSCLPGSLVVACSARLSGQLVSYPC